MNKWGYHIVLNMFDCDGFKISDYNTIKEFVIKLCDFIKMNRFGEPQIVKFGDNPDVYGYTLVQLIETSDIVGVFLPKTYITSHFAEQTNAIYLDIFSCKEYPIQDTVDFCINYFNAKNHNYSYIER